MKKGKDPDSYLLLMDPDPGGPKKCGSGSGSLTLVYVIASFWNNFKNPRLLSKQLFGVIDGYLKAGTSYLKAGTSFLRRLIGRIL
jgi:hypothetical protein